VIVSGTAAVTRGVERSPSWGPGDFFGEMPPGGPAPQRDGHRLDADVADGHDALELPRPRSMPGVHETVAKAIDERRGHADSAA
jgi:hypothetical protein